LYFPERREVLHIDVLGFADLIEQSRSDASTIAKIADLLEEIKAISILGASPSSPPEKTIFHSFKFSDMLVSSTEITTDVFELVDWGPFYLATLQISFAEGGVLIRGGICVGDQRRHKVSTRVAIRYSHDVVFGELGVLRLRHVHVGALPSASK
jgi:hypothetical protein